MLTEYELERSSFALEFEHIYSKLIKSLDSHVNKSHYVLEKILEQLVNNSIRTMYPIDSIVNTKSKDTSNLYQEFLNHFVKKDDITTFETATDLVIKQLNRDIKAARTIADLERLFYTIESIDKLVSYTPLIHDLLRELSHAIYTFRPKQNVENKLKLSSIFG